MYIHIHTYVYIYIYIYIHIHVFIYTYPRLVSKTTIGCKKTQIDRPYTL